MTKHQGNVITMKETLYAQQKLLHNLYSELEQEREASAIAANETLDMILRLQGEMALLKMEATQYKRMAEEKIDHAEATIEVFQEVMHQMEMEIAFLEFQVQAYKHKILSLGCDLNTNEFNRSDQRNGENGRSNTVRRIHSLPPKRERSSSPVVDVNPKIIEESTYKEVILNLTRKPVEFDCCTPDSYWDQIKMLDEKVEVISDRTEGEKSVILSSRRWKSCSTLSNTTKNITCDQIVGPYTNSYEVSHGEEDTQDIKEVGNPPCSPNVYDIFEVPQTTEKHKLSEYEKERHEKWNHDADKQKGMLRINSEIKRHSPNDMMTIIDQKKEGLAVNYNAKAEFQKLHQRIEWLEREMISTRNEVIHEGNGEDQFRMLKDIQIQLTLIKSEMRGRKTKKATLKDDKPLALLQEAMLHFWF
ncbi:PREDICTED: myosin-binding protein 7-like [Lupinus angustifolius]|uniref:myosin-binding protein 7-like n=1 Tax=Lupinus angustifolius TaxID=3871 RepID=UPI00092F70CA|nr:PREDICTED: myosin-binding protein 7-like [Lupinus angustifolius]